MCLIDSALRISSTITGSISAAVGASRCTNIQEELEEITDVHNRDGELAELRFLFLFFDWLTGWMYKRKVFFHCLKPCVSYYWNVHLYLNSVPDCLMWFIVFRSYVCSPFSFFEKKSKLITMQHFWWGIDLLHDSHLVCWGWGCMSSTALQNYVKHFHHTMVQLIDTRISVIKQSRKEARSSYSTLPTPMKETS